MIGDQIIENETSNDLEEGWEIDEEYKHEITICAIVRSVFIMIAAVSLFGAICITHRVFKITRW